MAEDVIAKHIEVTPGVCGGKPRIAGHRIRVQDIYEWHELMGWSPDEIASQFGLTLGDVHAALAYYFDHREEIQEEIRAERAEAEEFRRNNPSLLATKLTPSGAKEPS